MSVERVKALYELKLEGTDIYRWGKFDRDFVGELLEEIAKLSSIIQRWEIASRCSLEELEHFTSFINKGKTLQT